MSGDGCSTLRCFCHCFSLKSPAVCMCYSQILVFYSLSRLDPRGCTENALLPCQVGVPACDAKSMFILILQSSHSTLFGHFHWPQCALWVVSLFYELRYLYKNEINETQLTLRCINIIYGKQWPFYLGHLGQIKKE